MGCDSRDVAVQVFLLVCMQRLAALNRSNLTCSAVVILCVSIRAHGLNLNTSLGLNGMRCVGTSAAQCFSSRPYPCECVWWCPAKAAVAVCTGWFFCIRLWSAAAMWRCRQLVNAPTMMTQHLFIPKKTVQRLRISYMCGMR